MWSHWGCDLKIHLFLTIRYGQQVRAYFVHSRFSLEAPLVVISALIVLIAVTSPLDQMT
jgi:hypothetical protein